MILKQNKKALADPFNIASRFGYYILALMIISVLFLFFAVLIQGSQFTYYKNSYGTEVISLEERFFTEFAYEDPITGQLYQKVLDMEKFSSLQKADFERRLGLTNSDASPALHVIIKDSSQKLLFNQISSNYPTENEFTKVFPVVLVQNGVESSGFVVLNYAKI